MIAKKLFQLAFATICVLMLSACSSTADEPGPDSDASDASDMADAVDVADSSDDSEPDEEVPKAFTHKMMKQLDDNPFAALAYECQECTFEQWDSITAPEGWSKGPAQISLFSLPDSGMRSYPSVEGHDDTVNFIDDIPGNEYRIIAVTKDGRFIENGPSGLVIEAQVQRDTFLVFKSGMRVHELTDPEDNVFVLFVHHVDPENLDERDFQDPSVLDYLTAPEGWTYSTRILDERLTLDSSNSDGVVTVLAIRGDINSTWEKR